MHNVLIIGAGGVGRRHIKSYISTNRAIISIVEPDTEKCKAIEKDFQISQIFNSISEVNFSKYSLAIICTPANYHLEPMKICAEHHLPFMVEKPLSIYLEGVDDILSLVNSNKVFARVGYTRRNCFEARSARSKILDGKIGDLKIVLVNLSQNFPKYRPDFQRIYFANPETGGGSISDISCHAIDRLIWIIGKPTHVSCMFGTLVLEGINTEDTCFINLLFENGSMANITINHFQKPNTNTYEFIGTKGNILLNHSTLMFADDDSLQWKETKEYMKELDPMEVHQNNFLLQANKMLDGIEGKNCDLTTLEEAKLNLRVTLAAKKSWIEKRIIMLDKEDL